MMILTWLALTACGPQPVVCTDLAAASVMLSVVGADGATPLVADVTATDENGDPVQVQCSPTADSAACTDWIVGYEVSGQISIHATATDGCNTGTGDLVVDVPMDDQGCHVVGQHATLVVTDWTELGCGTTTP